MQKILFLKLVHGQAYGTHIQMHSSSSLQSNMTVKKVGLKSIFKVSSVDKPSNFPFPIQNYYHVDAGFTCIDL
jgi:hypothetical protein